jgi:hypothetical protein
MILCHEKFIKLINENSNNTFKNTIEENIGCILIGISGAVLS